MSNMCWHAFEHSLLGKTRLWLKETKRTKNYVDKVIGCTPLPTVTLRPPLASLSIQVSIFFSNTIIHFVCAYSFSKDNTTGSASIIVQDLL